MLITFAAIAESATTTGKGEPTFRGHLPAPLGADQCKFRSQPRGTPGTGDRLFEQVMVGRSHRRSTPGGPVFADGSYPLYPEQGPQAGGGEGGPFSESGIARWCVRSSVRRVLSIWSAGRIATRAGVTARSVEVR
jgi:hypothetical protein